MALYGNYGGNGMIKKICSKALRLAALLPLVLAVEVSARPDFDAVTEQDKQEARQLLAKMRKEWIAAHMAARKELFDSIQGVWDDEMEHIGNQNVKNVGVEAGEGWWWGTQPDNYREDKAVLNYFKSPVKPKTEAGMMAIRCVYMKANLKHDILRQTLNCREGSEEKCAEAMHAVKKTRRSLLLLEIVLLHEGYAVPDGAVTKDWKHIDGGKPLKLTGVVEGRDYELAPKPKPRPVRCDYVGHNF